MFISKKPEDSSIPSIREILNRIGAIHNDRVEILSTKTRDNSNLKVFRDILTRVIFIDNHYVGDAEYISGNYRKDIELFEKNTWQSIEDLTDNERRFNSYKHFLINKVICDFGCGAGGFLRISKPVIKKAYGIELQNNFLDELNSLNFNCYTNLDYVKEQLDVVTMFHCLEHLPNPTAVLKDIRKKLKDESNGLMIIEVPHARDFLIDHLNSKEFIEFTLWSQHLILHTRDSLHLLLADAGFKNIIIEGVQRYSISNHINWLANKSPGGHKSLLSILETDELRSSYKNALMKIDATDTLVAIATT